MVALLAALLALVTAGTVQERPRASASLTGTWLLDPYLSDHPEQVARALRVDIGQSSIEDVPAGAGRGEPERASENTPGTRGSGNVPPSRPPQREPLNETDRKLLTELTEAVRFPPPRLTIEQRDDAVTLTAGLTATTMHANGKSEKRQLAAGTVERTAAWEGPQLAVTYNVGHAGTLTYRYELAPTTRQLVVRINFERRPGEPGPFEIKLVYNSAASKGINQISERY